MKSEPVTVLIGLGSNVRPEEHLPRALAELAAVLRLEAVSAAYASVAVGAPGSPPFLNAAVKATTTLPPRQLKREVLARIEQELGRQRSADRNAPRTIDLDLLLYGEEIIEDAETGLVVPDPELLERAHTAVPAAEVWPQARHPRTGETLERIAARLAPGAGLRRLEALPGWPSVPHL